MVSEYQNKGLLSGNMGVSRLQRGHNPNVTDPSKMEKCTWNENGIHANYISSFQKWVKPQNRKENLQKKNIE